MPWGYVAVAGATLVGSSMAAGATSDAASAQAAASDASIAEQQRQFNITQANEAPFLANGTAANAQLSNLLGISGNTSAAGYGSLTQPFTAADLAADPVYQNAMGFGLSQGSAAINQQALQSGSYYSGATAKALTQYGNDYATTQGNNAYNRYNTTNSQIYNQLAGISGTGQTAAGQVATTGTNTANAISSDLTNQGNSTAAGIIGGSNAWGSGISSINGIYNNYNSNQQLQQLLGNSSSGTSNSLSGSYIAGNDATIY